MKPGKKAQKAFYREERKRLLDELDAVPFPPNPESPNWLAITREYWRACMRIDHLDDWAQREGLR
jgi:hypothetical protein